MKNKVFLDDLNLGKIVEELAGERLISATQITDAISHYKNNASKIFDREDMDTAEVVKISYLFNFNILMMLTKQYLPHLPYMNHIENHHAHIIEVNTLTSRCSFNKNIGKHDFLKNVEIGPYIGKVAAKKGLKPRDLQTLLGLSQSSVSRLFLSKSLNIKKMIRYSDLLEHNLFSEPYIQNMIFKSHAKSIDERFIIKVGEKRVDILDPCDGSIKRSFFSKICCDKCCEQ